MLYPFKFHPIVKPTLWGGNKIQVYKHLDLPAEEKIGESWEVSAIPGSVSVVANGDLKGMSLEAVINTYQEEVLGKSVINRYGLKFPLLIKFIDANQDLSIQVHPNDVLAQERYHSFGKTEMWYIIKADKNAYLYAGFAKDMTPDQYIESLKNNTFHHYLNKYEVRSGDTFFIPAGQVHAIGAGCFVAEIQQSSDITYRIYDYNRKDKEGNLRELHTELAHMVIDFTPCVDNKVKYTPGKETQNLIRSSHFSTNLIEGEQNQIIHLTHLDTFVIYICMEGKAILTDNKGNAIDIEQGETVLVPAQNSHLITLQVKENCRLLETY